MIIMRKLGARLLAIALTAALGGCGAMHGILEDGRKKIDEVAMTTSLSKTTLGAWLVKPKGGKFTPVDVLDHRNALVYIYRPTTRWGQQELQTPSFYMNGERIFGLKDGAYYWLELRPGKYLFAAKRPFAMAHLKTIFETDLSVDGGKTYYFRYDETEQIKKPADPPKLIEAGPLLEVPDTIALAEIDKTVLEQPGLFFQMELAARWKPFDLYPDEGMVVAGQVHQAGP